jgi:DNA-binding XRE family transcriptional regulator
MDIDWHIGDVITKLRRRARMNQTVLAGKVGVNKATIVRAEDGDVKVSRETYMKIAAALKTDLATLEGEAARLQADPDLIRRAVVPTSNTARALHVIPAQSGATETDIAGGPEHAESSSAIDDQSQANPLSGYRDQAEREALAAIKRIARSAEKAAGLVEPTRPTRVTGKHAAATRPSAAGRGARIRKPRR